MQTNRILYIGYGFNGEAGLDSLLKQGSFDIAAVVTPPLGVSRYRPTDKELPVETLARQHGLPILQTNAEHDIRAAIDRTKPTSVLTCVYNKLFSPELLRLGPSFYNLHHGDLPRWKGSSSSEWAIISGRNEIALTLHETVPDLDSGAILWQETVRVTDDETIVDMRRKMNDVLRRDLGAVYAHILHPEQSPELSARIRRRTQVGDPTYTVRIQGADCMIDWNKPAQHIHNLIRGLCDPELEQAFTFYDGHKLDVLAAKKTRSERVYEGHIPGKPVARSQRQGTVEVLTGDVNTNILLQEVCYRGEKMTAAQAIASTRNTLGLNHLDLLSRVQSLEAKIKSLESS